MPAVSTITLRRDFLSAAASGKKFITGSFIVQLRAREEAHPKGTEAIRFGFTVTKKMGNSVARSRIKRRLREAVREVALPLAKNGYDYVIISRTKALDCPFSDLLRDMEFAFSRIHANKRP
ncbi:MAG: ribonuclease P protein component [Alphaproteobacteria bacterium]|nr:ribonuclease P protein component [Alphaproteobacteria bacterium]